MNNSKIKNIAALGVFCAFAYVLTNIGNLIPIRFAGFLSFDPKDAIIVIAGFALGPVATIAISLTVALIEMITISTTGIIGFIMNVISSIAFAFIPALIYKTMRSFKSAIVSLAISSALTVIIMLGWNYFVTPVYMHVPRSAVETMLLPVFLPFNVLKCFLNTTLVAVFYKPIVKALRRIKLLSPSKKRSYKSFVKPRATIVNKYLKTK